MFAYTSISFREMDATYAFLGPSQYLEKKIPWLCEA